MHDTSFLGSMIQVSARRYSEILKMFLSVDDNRPLAFSRDVGCHLLLLWITFRLYVR